MYIFILGQILNIAAWQLYVSTIAIILTVLGMLWRFDAARKKDFNNKIKEKADLQLVKSEFKQRDEKINTMRVKLDEHEKNNLASFESIKDNFEELHSRMEYSNKKIDKVYEILINK